MLGAFTGSAIAGELPIYQPPAPWVVVRTLPTAASTDAGGNLLLDIQQRVEGARVSTYVDVATRLVTPELLAQNATLTLPWAPDKGDLIVHGVTIVRDGHSIDALAGGAKFTILRREQTLEQRELTGILSATLAVEGLQVDDILRVRVTNTLLDNALGGRAQFAGSLPAQPFRIATASYRLSFPAALALKWKLLARDTTASVVTRDGITEVSLSLPIAKQPEMPEDAPLRFRRSPLVEASTFANWSEVSQIMAPLYATAGTIAPGGPLAAEVATIVKRSVDPLQRAAAALQLVQDRTRYLAVGMDGGNYVPQSPARTWQLRYGDCKAKTLLLLAMLHMMGIEAEPVLASVGLGDSVPERLPSAAAFNHILVRATIGGRSLWLDGTQTGSRIDDLGDAPAFGTVLPVRMSGAEPMAIAPRPPARASLDITLDADESASVDLPAVLDVTAILRGPRATLLSLATSQLGAKEQRQAIASVLQEMIGTFQWAELSLTSNTTDGTVTIRGRGVTGTGWHLDERRMKRWLSRVPALVTFTPDRARPAWADIPVATSQPDRARFRLHIRLPEGGRGYTLDGQPDLTERLAGYDVRRTIALRDGIVSVDEELSSSGLEIAAATIANERDRVSTINARAPRIVAPVDARRRWNLDATDPPGSTQVKTIEAVFAAAIASADAEDITGLTSRASFRNGIGDRKGAIADLTRVLATQPTLQTYVQRSYAYVVLGDLASAARDAEAARKLDPASPEAIVQVAEVKARAGDLPGALKLLDERIALGGETRDRLRSQRAALLGDYGDPALALREYDALIAEKPGTPTFLNARCWVKATRQVMLDTALKDCTSAIELSDQSAAILDSRAVVFLRLNRYEEALRDIDAALLQAPGLGPSRFIRAIILTRMGRKPEAVRELAVARRLLPTIEADYARFGLTI